MNEIIENNNEFRISTPFEGGRLIKLIEPFKDEEFQSWHISYINKRHCILLGLNNANLIMYWDGDKFSGDDPRGGVSILVPGTNAIPKLKKFFTVNRKVSREPSGKTEIIRSSDVAIITKLHLDLDADIYIESGPLYLLFNKLFNSGYKYVFHLNRPVTSFYLESLISLQKQTKAQAVQGISSLATKDSNVITTNEGTWISYMIPLSTWTKLKKVLSSKTNFLYAISQEFKRRRYRRIVINRRSPMYIEKDLDMTLFIKTQDKYHGAAISKR